MGFTMKKKLACIALSCVLLLSVVVLFINVQAPEVSKIAFGSGLRHPGNPLVRSEIYVMDEDGNNQRRLTQNPAIEGSPAPGPSLRIAFSSRRDWNDEIYVMDADGNNQRRLTNNPVFDKTPAWFSTANTISLKCLCIDRVNQVKKFAWSGTRSLVSVQIRRGKMPRLRCKWAIYLRHHMHCYSREMV